MKLSLLVTGKTDFGYITEGIKLYTERVSRYIHFDVETIKDIKKSVSLPVEVIKKEEGAEILKKLQPGDWVILLDEKGKEMKSVEFASFMQQRMNAGYKRMVFIIGGAYGFSNEVYQRSNEAISLSKMTYSHQIVRLIFMEQLYRAFTIIKGEPYHHE